MSASSTNPKQIDAYVAFEGGGAKGIVHVGALKAISERARIAGVAGTSAGAIVAALCAAGYSADSMLDPEQGTSILNELGPRYSKATDLLGQRNWWAMRLFSLLSTHVRKLAGVVLLLYISLLWLAAHLGATWAVWVSPLFWGAFWLLLWAGYLGFASVKHLHRALHEVLRKKLELAAGDEARFRHFGNDSGRPPLKIVAADISQQRLRVFSPETTPDISVADAVCASICIPLVFRPWRFKLPGGVSTFLDGGLVSNLPAWTFDEERMLNPSAYSIAVEIVDRPTDPRGTVRHWLPAALRTAIFGRGVLNKRASGELITLRLNTELGLLQFDAPRRQLDLTVKEAAAAAAEILRYELEELPDSMQRASRDIHQLLTATLEGVGAGPDPSRGERLRVAFAAQHEDRKLSLQLRYSTGYQDNDPDRDAVIPIHGSLTGSVLSSGKASVFRIDLDQIRTASQGDAMLQRLVDQTWPELRWCFCVPIKFPEPRPKGLQWRSLLVTVDGNFSLNDAGEAACYFLADRRNIQDLVGKALQLGAPA